MPFLFGYGSIIYPPSISNTLGRTVDYNDLQCATLKGYIRTWSAPGIIDLLADDGNTNSYKALFLDLTPKADHICNGVAIEISYDELAEFDIREKGYLREKVQLEICGGEQLEAYTYIVKDEHKSCTGVITAKYLEMIDNALENYPQEFAIEFRSATEPSTAPVLEGEYIFKDPCQNKACKRTLKPKSE